MSIPDWGKRTRMLSSVPRWNISFKGLDPECCSLMGCQWLMYFNVVHLTSSYLASYLPCAVSNVAAMTVDKESPVKLAAARAYFLPSYGRECQVGVWAETVSQLAQILSLHRFILSRPHMLNLQCVGTKEGAMAWFNTAVRYCGETSCNALCQSALVPVSRQRKY